MPRLDSHHHNVTQCTPHRTLTLYVIAQVCCWQASPFSLLPGPLFMLTLLLVCMSPFLRTQHKHPLAWPCQGAGNIGPLCPLVFVCSPSSRCPSPLQIVSRLVDLSNIAGRQALQPHVNGHDPDTVSQRHQCHIPTTPTPPPEDTNTTYQ